ncbi:hypothetical protein [Myroides odoratus]|uniref:hypothetical protein n=1 Tax=Myroides odoratus TaxID=256 RepID=UPI0033416042
MYIANFDIENISDAKRLHLYISDLGFDVIQNKHEVLVSSHNEDVIKNVIKQGNQFLNHLEAIFDSWRSEQEVDYMENTIENPYYQYGVSEKDFY